MERPAPRMVLQHFLTFGSMAIIEMIPPQYWAQMRRELNSLSLSELRRIAHEAAAPGTSISYRMPETSAERSARIAAEYDAAILRRQKQNMNEAAAARRLTPEYQETQRRAAARRKERRAAERAANPPKPPGRPRAPTDGLTPEQIAKREFNRERAAQYRKQCREGQRRLEERRQDGK